MTTLKVIIVSFAVAGVIAFVVVKFTTIYVDHRAAKAQKVCVAAGGDHVINVRGTLLCISADGRILN
jgi:hypothetical protein